MADRPTGIGHYQTITDGCSVARQMQAPADAAGTFRLNVQTHGRSQPVDYATVRVDGA